MGISGRLTVARPTRIERRSHKLEGRGKLKDIAEAEVKKIIGLVFDWLLFKGRSTGGFASFGDDHHRTNWRTISRSFAAQWHSHHHIRP